MLLDSGTDFYEFTSVRMGRPDVLSQTEQDALVFSKRPVEMDWNLASYASPALCFKRLAVLHSAQKGKYCFRIVSNLAPFLLLQARG